MIQKLGFELPYDACQECQLNIPGMEYKGLARDVSWGDWDKHIDYIFVVDKGTDYDKVLGGKDGKIFLQILEEIGLKNWFITSATLCRPAEGKTPTVTDILSCYNNTETILQSIIKVNQINQATPPTIIILGKEALKRFTTDKALLKASVGSLVGQEMSLDEYPGCPIYMTYNPAAIIYNESYFGLLKADLLSISNKRQGISQSTGTYFMIRSMDTFEQVFEYLKDQPRISYDIETTGKNYQTMLEIIEKKRKRKGQIVLDYSENWRTDMIIGISFSAAAYEGVYIPLWVKGKDFINSPYAHAFEGEIFSDEFYFWFGEDNKKVILEGIRVLLENLQTEKIAHNGKFDNQFLKVQLGIEISNFYIDTMLLSYLQNENSPNSLEYLVNTKYPDLAGYKQTVHSRISKKKQAEENYSDLDLETLAQYGCRDADATFRLSYDLMEDLKKEMKDVPGEWYNPKWLLENLYMPLSKVYQNAELYGIKVDRDYAENLAKEFDIENLNTEKAFAETFGEIINLNSAQQLQKLMYTDLCWPVFKATGKDDKRTLRDKIPPEEGSTDQNTLKILLEYFETHNSTGKFDGEIDMLTELLRYKKYKKLTGTYLRGKKLFNRMDAYSRIHTSYLLHGTKTGRLCVDGNTKILTNLGEIPIKEITDKLICEDLQAFTHNNNYQKITDLIYKGKEEMFEVILENGKSIICTENHIFQTTNGWKKLKDIQEEGVYSYERS